MSKILVIHGPNLDLLGKRETNIYGKDTLESINKKLKDKALEKGHELIVFQSNHEGDIVDQVGKSTENNIDAIVINPAAYTHTSVAIRDAISAVQTPIIEVHLSNIYSREEFRHTSLISAVAEGQICGFGVNSYMLGLDAAIGLLEAKNG